jgi:5'-nucleotidase / UDP-sugar diphosphatase
MSSSSGAFTQFAGISLLIEDGLVKNVRVQNLPLDMAKTYTMTVNNFVAAGGDGYPKLTGHPSFTDTGFADADALRAYIAANSPLKAANFAPGEAVVRR